MLDTIPAETAMTQEQALERQADASARFAADLYYYVARRVIEELGVAGEAAVRRGLAEFGEARGAAIRLEAEAAGDTLDLAAFLSHYNLPMGRAWRSNVTLTENRRESVIERCPFADQWKVRPGGPAIGQIYCEEVDPAIRRGYAPDLHFNVARYILRAGDRCEQTDEVRP